MLPLYLGGVPNMKQEVLFVAEIMALHVSVAHGCNKGDDLPRYNQKAATELI